MKRIAAAALVGMTCLAVFSMQSAPAARTADARSAAAAVVERYLGAIHNRSCPELIAVSARVHDQTSCEAELHDFIEHHAELVGVARLAPDGRNPQVWLATARLRADGREREVLLRVTRGPTGLRVET